MPEYVSKAASPAAYLPQETPGGARQSGTAIDLAPLLAYIEAAGFYFAPWQVATFVTAVRTKPFVILAGISGTGKTKLPQLVGEATGTKIEIVPVRPDWTDSSDLLGYERLNATFAPGRLLTLCKEAIDNPTVQYFFVLGEMNVARVEYYFAEVLSLMENRRDVGGTTRTDALNPLAPNELLTATAATGATDWSAVYLPSNVSIIGTVNMDETTHGFSRKVLDRAFVLELSDVDLSAIVPAARGAAAPAPQSWSAEDWASPLLRLSDSDELGDPVVVEAVSALVRANDALQQAQLQVGFRVRDEVALFCLNARAYAEQFVESDQTVVSPLDLCLNMKVLPRVQGGGALIGKVLKGLAEWTATSDGSGDGSETPSGFPRTHDRVRLMRSRLEQTGFTSYWI